MSKLLFSSKPRKKFGTDLSCRFREKLKNRLTPTRITSEKNDVTMPKATLITIKVSFSKVFKSDDFTFKQFCLQMVAETDLYKLLT